MKEDMPHQYGVLKPNLASIQQITNVREFIESKLQKAGTITRAELELRAEGQEPHAAYRTLTMGELMRYDFKPLEVWMSPWLTSQSLSMVYARRGIGKTFFALDVALAVARGGCALGKWFAADPRKVLYVDGELPGAVLKNRIEMLAGGVPDCDNLAFLTGDALGDEPPPDVSEAIGQARLDATIEAHQAEFIILDNLSCLVRSGRENESEAWVPVQSWLLRHRTAGRSVMLIHHAGKNGDQRGASKREDMLDAVIELKHSSDYQADRGCQFETWFTKARNLSGKAAEPFEATLAQVHPGRHEWKTRTIEDKVNHQIIELKAAGMNQSAIARELGIDRATVSRRIKALQQKQL